MDGWTLEDDVTTWGRKIFRGELLNFGGVDWIVTYLDI